MLPVREIAPCLQAGLRSFLLGANAASLRSWSQPRDAFGTGTHACFCATECGILDSRRSIFGRYSVTPQGRLSFISRVAEQLDLLRSIVSFRSCALRVLMPGDPAAYCLRDRSIGGIFQLVSGCEHLSGHQDMDLGLANGEFGYHQWLVNIV